MGLDPNVDLRIEFSALCSGNCVKFALFVVLKVYCSLFSVWGDGVVLHLLCVVCSMNCEGLRGVRGLWGD